MHDLEKLNQQLQSSLGKMDLVLGAIDEAIIWTDTNALIEWCNDAFIKLIDRPRITTLGKNLAEVLPLQSITDNSKIPAKQHPVYATNMQAKATQHIYKYTNNETIFDLDVATHFLEHAPHDPSIIMLIRDITKQRELEAQKYKIDQMKNEFISTVSHELRTPLTSIRGSLGLIMGGAMGAVPKEMTSLLEIACNNSERLVRLVNDILDIEKLEAGKMIFHFARIDLSKLIEQAVIANKPYADKYQVTYKIEKLEPGVQVLIDSDRIRQVLDNLLSNAAKFSKAGGTIWVSMQLKNGNVRVSVTDSGSGIPQEFQDKIFAKFYQADSSSIREKGGTGLGLSICKSIVEAHKGTIGFKSTPDVGTTFYFELLEERTQADHNISAEVGERENKILICEDEPDVSKLLGLILRDRGLSTVQVSSIAEAKKMLLKQTFSLMTLDLILPDGNGLELLQWLRTQAALVKLPVIVISAVSIEEEKVKGSALGIVDWINKPIDEDRLYKDVLTALGNKNHKTKPRVLHVEDDADVAKVVATVIKDIAYTDICVSVTAAKQLLEDNKYQAIILDLNLQDAQSGYEVLTFLQEKGYNIPVVILSVDEFESDVTANIAASMVKSRVSNSDLLEKIVSIIEKGG